MGMANGASQAMCIVSIPERSLFLAKECLQRCRAVWSIYPTVSALNGPVQTSPLDPFCVLMVFVGAEVCLSAVSRSSSTVTGSAMVGLWEPQRRQLWQVAK